MHWGFQDKKWIIDDCIFLNYCKKNLCVSNCLWGEWRVKMLWYLSSIVDYQLVFPIIVDHNGSFLSHWNSTHSSQHHRSTKQLHLNITGFNQTFCLHLHTSSNILAPGFKVYYRHGNSNHSNEAEEHSSGCEFKGRLLSHSTEVALSLCGGVVSFYARYWFNSSIFNLIFLNCVQMILSPWQILGKVATLVKWNNELPKFLCRLIITFT